MIGGPRAMNASPREQLPSQLRFLHGSRIRRCDDKNERLLGDRYVHLRRIGKFLGLRHVRDEEERDGETDDDESHAKLLQFDFRTALIFTA